MGIELPTTPLPIGELSERHTAWVSPDSSANTATILLRLEAAKPIAINSPIPLTWGITTSGQARRRRGPESLGPLCLACFADSCGVSSGLRLLV